LLLLLLWFALSLALFLSAMPPSTAPLRRSSSFLRSKPRALAATTTDAAAVAPRVRIYVYDLPARFNREWAAADARCSRHLFAAEVAVHEALLAYVGRAARPEDADLFFVPVYVSCNFSTPNGFPCCRTPEVCSPTPSTSSGPGCRTGTASRGPTTSSSRPTTSAPASIPW
jgi:probable glucuronoxylan glucuronosyltransferase IRX7